MSSLRRRFVMPTALVVSLGVAACSAPSAVFHRYGPADYVELAAVDGFVPAHPIDTTAGDKPGRLVGPHYSLELLGHSVSHSVSAADAARYGFSGGPVQARPGTEFFLAVVGDAVVEAGATAQIVIDGVPRALERLPVTGEGIAAVIPKGAAVLLRITDAGRVQSIDLRDGSRPEQIDAFYNAALVTADPADYAEDGVATGHPDGEYESAQRMVTLTMTIGPAERSPWLADVGWAADGEVWVAVPVSEIATNSVYGFDTSPGSHEPMIYWEFKQDDVFHMASDAGSSVGAEGNPTFTADESSAPVTTNMDSFFDPSSVVLVFSIPERATTATLTVAPTGSLKAVWKNVEGIGDWNHEPDEYTVDFEF